MLMRTHDGAVDHGVFVVGVGCQMLEDAFPNPRFRPSAVSAMHILPITETFRQIAPRNAGPVSIQHRLNEQAIVGRSHPDVALTPGKKVANTLPLIVTKAVASHRSAPSWLIPYESKFAPPRNPPK